MAQDLLTRDRWPIVAREGWIVIVGVAVVAAGATALIGWLLPGAGLIAGVAGALIILWAIWFFRDPERRCVEAEQERERLGTTDRIVCPADGVVCFIGPAELPEELRTPADVDRSGLMRISIFMNVFNVHVNRAPVDGVVVATAYRAGKFFNAALDKASIHNERASLLLQTRTGAAVGVVQIAGLVARRIVCRARVGEIYQAGDRFGLIRFGSRVDVYLPSALASLTVQVGRKVRAGETVLGALTAAGTNEKRAVAEAVA